MDFEKVFHAIPEIEGAVISLDVIDTQALFRHIGQP
jgi:hypothetical protein